MPEGRDGRGAQNLLSQAGDEISSRPNPGDATAEVKFKEISEAYDVLKDDQKRAAYDRFGHAAFEGGMGAAGAAASPFDFAGSFSDVFEDFFGDMMGGCARRRRGNRGQDLRYNLEITLEEAFRGRSAEIKVPTMVACETCHGSGAEAGHSAETCPTCAGHGKVRATQGFFTIERSCSRLPRQRQDHPPSLQDLPRRGRWCRRSGC